MTSKRLDLYSKMNPVEKATLSAALNDWMGVLEMKPMLLLGLHEPTGGLLVVPIFDKDATTGDVLELLSYAIAYIRESQSS